jgi:hypothetical protein
MRSSQSAKRCIRRRQLFEISRRCFGWQAAFCVALNLSLMERFRQWPLAKINDRALKNVARLVDTQSRATVAMEERQAKFVLMNINPFFAGTRDRKVPHERYDVAGRNIEQFAQQCGVYQKCTIADFNLHGVLIRPAAGRAFAVSAESNVVRSKREGRSLETTPTMPRPLHPKWAPTRQARSR